jgi:hypothetical protein
VTDFCITLSPFKRIIQNLAVKWSFNFIRFKPIGNITYLGTAWSLLTASTVSSVARRVVGCGFTEVLYFKIFLGGGDYEVMDIFYSAIHFMELEDYKSVTSLKSSLYEVPKFNEKLGPKSRLQKPTVAQLVRKFFILY